MARVCAARSSPFICYPRTPQKRKPNIAYSKPQSVTPMKVPPGADHPYRPTLATLVTTSLLIVSEKKFSARNHLCTVSCGRDEIWAVCRVFQQLETQFSKVSTMWAVVCGRALACNSNNCFDFRPRHLVWIVGFEFVDQRFTVAYTGDYRPLFYIMLQYRLICVP